MFKNCYLSQSVILDTYLTDRIPYYETGRISGSPLNLEITNFFLKSVLELAIDIFTSETDFKLMGELSLPQHPDTYVPPVPPLKLKVSINRAYLEKKSGSSYVKDLNLPPPPLNLREICRNYGADGGVWGHITLCI